MDFQSNFTKRDSAMWKLIFTEFFLSEKAKPLIIYPSIRIGGFRNLIFGFVDYHPGFGASNKLKLRPLPIVVGHGGEMWDFLFC